MAKKIRVWDGTTWQEVGVSASLPVGFNVILSGNATLEATKKYFVNTSAARTLTLPASPAQGDEISVYDSTGSAGTNNITLNSNSNKINGVVQNLDIDVAYGAVSLIYTGSGYGWRLI